VSQIFGFRTNKIVLDNISHSKGLADLLDEIDLDPPFIVKPNWINEELAHQTDPVVLSWFLTHLASEGETFLVEAYSARNRVMKLKGPEGETKLERYRRTEAEFIHRQGLSDLIEEPGITYLNVDEEVWAGRTVEPEEVRSRTESRYRPVERSELYAFVPSALYDLRHGTLISLAKFKLTFSMCTKNIFGLIPDLVQPGGRGSYHGKKDRKLPRNIIDINKIYRANFNVVGIVEGVRSLTGFINRGSHHSMFGYDYEVHRNRGLMYFGTDPLWLDAFVACQCGIDPRSYATSVLPQPHLALGYRELDPWPEELEACARDLGSPLEGSQPS
jgi:uncharacterized protein (DUF362 family)